MLDPHTPSGVELAYDRGLEMLGETMDRCPHCAREFETKQQYNSHMYLRKKTGKCSRQRGQYTAGVLHVTYWQDFMRAVDEAERRDEEPWTVDEDTEHFT